MQNKNIGLKIPASFRSPLFNPDKDSFHHLNVTDISQVLSEEPFYFDMLYNLKENIEYNPWENPRDSVSIIFEEWKRVRGKARDSFKDLRGKSNISEERLLVHCVSLFIVCLYWLNKRPVPGLHTSNMQLEQLKIKPVNCEERLLFIISKPTQYHAYIQLEQLFNECEKMFAKAIVLKQI
ncbi:hypothetical protein CJ195_05530 [Bacillus sp. UMB0899]|nr:hypothetical protein CJ195_05530 [Bacillus sp. UMB0899]